MTGKLRRAAWRARERTLSMTLDLAQERGDEALAKRYYAALVEHQESRPLADSLMDPWPVRCARDELEERKRRNADRDQWHGAETLSEIGEVTARWLEGDIVHNDGYNGRPDSETDVIAAPLAAANRAGFVTSCSQPGGHWDDPRHGTWTQRAAVDGFADAHNAARLSEIGERHGLRVITHRPTRWRTRFDEAETVTVTGLPDGVYRAYTGFGVQLSKRDLNGPNLGWHAPNAVKAAQGAWQVTLMDPDWGSTARLVAALDEFAGRAPRRPPDLFSDQQRVEHAVWKGADGLPQRGTVHRAELPPDRQDGDERIAWEVRWDGTDAVDRVSTVAADLRPHVPPDLPAMPRPGDPPGERLADVPPPRPARGGELWAAAADKLTAYCRRV